MGVRRIQLPYQEQPSGRAELSQSLIRSPLARVISGGSPLDLVTGVWATQDGLPRAAYPAGVGISFSGSTSERVDYDMPVSSGDMTLVAVFQAQTGAISICGAFNTTSASACSNYVSIESGNLLSAVSTESNNWVVANGPVVTYGAVYRVVAVFTANGGRKLFVNGALAASNATARNPTGLNKFQTGLYHGGTASGYASPFKGVIGDSILLPYALADAEAADLSANPHQIFERTIYVPSLSAGGAVNLVIANATHAQNADSFALTSQTALTIADAAHAQLADNLTLQAGALLAVADATHAHTLAAPTLTTQQLLAIADALHAQYADNVNLSNAPFLAIQDATHAQVADAFALSVQTLLAVQDMQHAQTAEVVTLGVVGEVMLAIQSLLHSHRVDMVTFASGIVRAALASRTYLRMTGAGHRPAQRSTARRH